MDSRVDNIVGDFKQFDQWEDRYKHLISLGKSMEAMPEADKVEENKVKGCQSQVWLSAHFKDNHISYYGDSDASIVKGIVALLLKVYSERTPEDILSLEESFIGEIGLEKQLSMSRTNGLNSMLKQIRMYALAFKTKRDMGLS